MPHGCGVSLANAAGPCKKVATLCAQCDCDIQEPEEPVRGDYSCCLPPGSLLGVALYIEGHVTRRRPRLRPVVPETNVPLKAISVIQEIPASGWSTA
jgi:hypothetical protein